MDDLKDPKLCEEVKDDYGDFKEVKNNDNGDVKKEGGGKEEVSNGQRDDDDENKLGENNAYDNNDDEEEMKGNYEEENEVDEEDDEENKEEKEDKVGELEDLTSTEPLGLFGDKALSQPRRKSVVPLGSRNHSGPESVSSLSSSSLSSFTSRFLFSLSRETQSYQSSRSIRSPEGGDSSTTLRSSPPPGI